MRRRRLRTESKGYKLSIAVARILDCTAHMTDKEAQNCIKMRKEEVIPSSLRSGSLYCFDDFRNYSKNTSIHVKVCYPVDHQKGE
jgi:hypothetical protein